MNDRQTSDTEAAPPAGAPEASENSACVLLVEDDRSLRRFLEVTLQRAGYRVISAGDGLEAMKMAFSDAIDVVVTDAIMPHLSGQQLAAFIRNNPKLAKVPIILLTGQENKATVTTVDAAIDAFLYKPVNADELKNCIEDCLSKRSDQLSN